MASREGNRDQAVDGFLNDGPRPVSKLEKALAGQPADTILRVRDYARTFDVDEDDEIFALMAAFKFLTVLVEDAPETWQALFDEVLQDLERWGVRQHQSFSEIQGYAAAANELSNNLKRAISGIDKANTSRHVLKQAVLQAIADSAGQSEQSAKGLRARLETTEERLTMLQQSNQFIAMVAGVGVIVSVMVMVVAGVSGKRLSHQNQELRQALAWQQQRTGWLLEKANREECARGIKPLSDPQCQ